MGFVLGTAAPAPAPGPAGGGAVPGPVRQWPWWPWITAWPPWLSPSQAEQTVCRNCFLSANSLEITNPSPGPGAPRRGVRSSAWVHGAGRCEHRPTETSPFGCHRLVMSHHPETPSHLPPHANHGAAHPAGWRGPWAGGDSPPLRVGSACRTSPRSSQLCRQPDQTQTGCSSACLQRQRPITKYAVFISIYSWFAYIFDFLLFYFMSKHMCASLSLQHLPQLCKTHLNCISCV